MILPRRSDLPPTQPAMILCAADVPVDGDRPNRDHPLRVRAAVTYFARFAASRGVNVAVRAEPAIVSLVLGESRRFEGHGYVFLAPGVADPAVLETADWSSGHVVETPDAAQLRATLVNLPTAVGAVFIGGARDTLDDYGALLGRQPRLPLYPVGSTGSAASIILDRHDPVGRNIDRDILERCPSYPLVMRHIFDDLEDALQDFSRRD